MVVMVFSVFSVFLWLIKYQTGAIDGDRSISRASRRALGQNPDVRENGDFTDRGSRSDQLVRAANLRREEQGRARDHAQRAEGRVQALRDGSRISSSTEKGISRDIERNSLSIGRHRRARRRSGGIS